MAVASRPGNAKTWSRLDVRLAAGVLSHKLQTAACSFVTQPDNQLKDLCFFFRGVLELGVDSKQWEPADLGSGTLLSSHPATASRFTWASGWRRLNGMLMTTDMSQRQTPHGTGCHRSPAGYSRQKILIDLESGVFQIPAISAIVLLDTNHVFLLAHCGSERLTRCATS